MLSGKFALFGSRENGVKANKMRFWVCFILSGLVESVFGLFEKVSIMHFLSNRRM